MDEPRKRDDVATASDEQEDSAVEIELVDTDLDAVAGGTVDGGCIPTNPIWPN